jgi:hypothetical protein
MTDKLATVRALLAKARNPGVTAEEAESYRAKALELAARYSLEGALAAGRDGNRGKPVSEEIMFYPDLDGGGVLTAKAAVHLITTIAGRLYCATVQWVESWGASVTVIGFPDDVAAVRALYTALLLQMADGAARAEVPPGRDPATFRRSFIHGFADRVGERLKPPEHEASAPGAELVLRDRWDEITAARDELYPDSEPVRNGRPVVSAAGLEAGRAAGAVADIGRPRAGTGARRELGA